MGIYLLSYAYINMTSVFITLIGNLEIFSKWTIYLVSQKYFHRSYVNHIFSVDLDLPSHICTYLYFSHVFTIWHFLLQKSCNTFSYFSHSTQGIHLLFYTQRQIFYALLLSKPNNIWHVVVFQKGIHTHIYIDISAFIT